MRNIRLLVYISLLFAFVSCVPTKDMVYLQKKQQENAGQDVEPFVAKPYRLQTNDILQITIKALDQQLVEMFNPSTTNVNMMPTNENLYFTGYTVDDHGMIRVPVLGEVNVLGRTLDETRQLIEKKLLDEYFNKEATIYVNVKLAGFRYTINGEVTHPGSMVLMQEKVNIMEALANAGDITITGDRKSVAVIRQYPQGAEIHTIDLTDRDAMKSPYYYLQPNDYIYVKPLPQKSWGTGTTGVQTFSTILSVMAFMTSVILLINR